MTVFGAKDYMVQSAAVTRHKLDLVQPLRGWRMTDRIARGGLIYWGKLTSFMGPPGLHPRGSGDIAPTGQRKNIQYHTSIDVKTRLVWKIFIDFFPAATTAHSVSDSTSSEGASSPVPGVEPLDPHR